LKKMKDQGTSPSDMVTLSNEFVKNSPQNLGEPVDTYKPDESRERRIKMSGLLNRLPYHQFLSCPHSANQSSYFWGPF